MRGGKITVHHSVFKSELNPNCQTFWIQPKVEILSLKRRSNLNFKFFTLSQFKYNKYNHHKVSSLRWRRKVGSYLKIKMYSIVCLTNHAVCVVDEVVTGNKDFTLSRFENEEKQRLLPNPKSEAAEVGNKHFTFFFAQLPILVFSNPQK